jgi:hypothetical protein
MELIKIKEKVTVRQVEKMIKSNGFYSNISTKIAVGQPRNTRKLRLETC